MKTTIKSIATALLMIVSLSSFAKVNANPLMGKSTADIMVAYAEAVVEGNSLLNKYLFTEDFTYENTANQQTFDKKKYMKLIESNKGLKFDCTTNYQILDQTGKSCVAKVTMDFEIFQRVDLITLKFTEEGWKISEVVTTYP